MPVRSVWRMARVQLVRPRSAITALTLSMFAAAAVPALAQETSSPSRETELERAIGEASAAEIAALAELGAATDRRLAAELELAALDRQLAEAQTRVGDAEAAADRASSAYFAVQYKLDQAERRVREARAVSRSATGNWYIAAGDDSLTPVAALFDDDFSSAGARSEYLDAVSQVTQEAALVAEADAAELEAMRAEVSASRDAERDALDAAEAERESLAVLREQQADVRADLVRAEDDERRLVETIRARKGEYEDELNRLRVESGSIGEMLAARQSSQIRSPLVMAMRPVPGPIVSEYGPRLHPILGYVRMHQGVDMDASMGDPIFAYADGVVVWADERGGYGNCVIIDHGNQFATLYAHQSELAVRIGDTVRGGQTIGFIGSTGLSSGPHLHFEVRDLGVPIDPEPLLAP